MGETLILWITCTNVRSCGQSVDEDKKMDLCGTRETVELGQNGHGTKLASWYIVGSDNVNFGQIGSGIKWTLDNVNLGQSG